MPKLLNHVPKYRRHSSRDVAFIEIGGRRTYFPGAYGSKESRQAYRRFVGEWHAEGRPADPKPEPQAITVAELLTRFWRFAKGHYVKNGEPTSELDGLKQAIRFLRGMYDTTLAGEFGPLALKAIRQRAVDSGLARTTCNKVANRIRRIFKWAASEQLVPVHTWQALSTVQGLQRGRTSARETLPVLPVDAGTVEQTLPHLPVVVADMVRIQRLTGMRPAEVVLLRPADIDRSGDVWRFVPGSHKTEHRGRTRSIYIGPQAQTILSRYLLRPADSFCFSPQESERQRRELAHEQRTTPLDYGNAPGSNRKGRPKRTAGERYDVAAYRRAITRGCEIAFGMPEEQRRMPTDVSEAERARLRKMASQWRAQHCWAPNQLRHAAATSIRAEFGIEAARTVLGHSDIGTTQIYAEADERLAIKVAAKLG